MTVHPMKLNRIPFEMVKNGTKTIECRLFDEKRQKIALGDTILFTKINSSETIAVSVVGLLRYKTFEEMFSRHEPQKFGGESVGELTTALLALYPREKQLERGVLGIDIQRKPDAL